MNIAISKNQIGNETINSINARELHSFLDVKTKYNDWFNRMCEYGFVENEDYIAITQKRVTAQGNESTYIDHIVSLDMAKEISMLQRTNKGKQARKYFIECEKQLSSKSLQLPDFTNPAIAARAWADENEAKQVAYKQLEEQKPKVDLADSIMASKTSILVRDMAKIICQNGFDMGEKRLYAWLRDHGYLIKKIGMDYNSPTQKSMSLGLFEIKETPIERSYGYITISKTPKVTGKGQCYFINKFKQIKEKQLAIAA